MNKINLYLLLVLVFLLALPQNKVEAACTIRDGSLAFGQNNLAVKDLQLCLLAEGYTIPAGATAYYGEQTKQAVQRFYGDKLNLYSWHGLSVGPLGREKISGLSQMVVSPSSGYKQAKNEETLKKYLAETNNLDFDQRGLSGNLSLGNVPASDKSESVQAPSAVPQRVSETTVQVVGVDEPDIVKTNGQTLFYARNNWYGWPIMPMVREGFMEDRMMIAPYPENPGSTEVIDIFPPTDLKISKKITETGDLLLDKNTNTLLVLASPKIIAYDVADQNNPKKLWDWEIPQNSSLVTARLNSGKIYLVTQTWIDRNNPCPIRPLHTSDRAFVPCSDIYIPIEIEPISATYQIVKFDPVSGNVEKKVAFASDGSVTTVMMSMNNLYLATRAYTEPMTVRLEIMSTVAKKYLTADAVATINKIRGYEISSSGKLNEINIVIEKELNRLDADSRLKVAMNLQNDMDTELARRQRDLEATRIARLDLATLGIQAVGTVPGSLLNQFSLDEYQSNLRVSTTIGNNNWSAWGSNSQSVNDVYVLSPDLKKIGEVLDLGKGERIYSTRFMGDEGYVVTFRQIDPFYVIDLSNPSAPKLSGELEIPGYSSYLEKISDNLVLGVGREDNSVKVSLFDVSIASSPKEVAKYLLKDEWSEVESSHHAFMLDSANKIFFIPGGRGGYFFNYSNNDLKLEATVAEGSVARAIYIDDYYYVIGNSAITVLDIKTWKEVAELVLN